ILRGVENEVQGRRITEELKVSSRRRAQEEARKTTLEDFFQKLAEGHTRDMRILLKGDVQGSVEALGSLLAQLSDSEVALNIIRSDVGDISESDIMLASASDAVVVGFHVGIDTRVRQLARQEGVDVRLYNIIYEAVDEIRLALEGMLSPIVEESVTGEAVVLEVFKISKVGRIAGCRVESGKLRKGAKVRLRREGETVTEDTISQLKRFKDSVEEVTSGQECGIALANFHDFQAGDVLQSIQVTRTARRL
nr:EF-Tu/IF-2/RF-3 family GTPase [bacterium]